MQINFIYEKSICIHPKTNTEHHFRTSILMPSFFHVNIFVAKFENNLKKQNKNPLRTRT